MASCNAPTATVSGYQLLPHSIPLGDELFFDRVDYGFIRRIRYKTVFKRYNDQGVEPMPQQLLPVNEFIVRRNDWKQNEISAVENFLNAHFGTAVPFLITAPDDGQTYEVRLKEPFSYTAHSSGEWSADLVLIEVGDLDNSIENDLVYDSQPLVEELGDT